MKIINLTQGQSTQVDDEDFEKLNKYKWFAWFCKSTNSYYAIRQTKGTPQIVVRMHREVVNCPKGKVVDHINGDTLDNRKENLRICTQGENTKNRRDKNKNNTSGLKGVCLRKTKHKGKVYQTWVAQIGIDKKRVYLGSFKTKELAHEAYKEASKKYHKEYGHY